MSRFRKARLLLLAALVLCTAAFAGCDGDGSRAETVEPLSQSMNAASAAIEAPTRRSSDGPDAILEFGLFGPVVPTLGVEASEVDCRFDDDPYETCL